MVLNAEIDRLKAWAEDEEKALSARQEEYRRRIAALRSKSVSTGNFTERFDLNQDVAELEKERRADEDRMRPLAAQVKEKRDALMAAARAKSTARFWDEEMFVARFRVVSR